MGSDMAARKAASLLKFSAFVASSFATVSASAQTWTGGTPYGGTVSVLAQSQDAQTLFAGTNGGLFRSDDGGLHWSRKLGGAPGSGPAEFAALALSSAHPGRLWIADARGRIHRSDDNGETIVATTTLPVANAVITQLLAAPGDNELLYVVSLNAGLWYSADAGTTFARADDGLDFGVAKLAVSPSAPARLMAFTSLSVDSLYIGDPSAWYMPPDFGAHPVAGVFAGDHGMFVATQGVGSPGVWYSYSYGPWVRQPIGCRTPNSLLLDAAGENLQWIGCGEGLVGTTPPFAPPMVIDGVQAPIRQLLRDHAVTDQLWAAAEHVGVFTSADAGQSWAPRNDGLSATSFRSVAVHPHSHRLYAGYIDESTVTTNPSIMFSDDDGVTWTDSDLGNLVWLTRAITVDPTVQDVDSTPVYAGGIGDYGPTSIYKSIDGGRTFSALGGASGPYTRTVRDIVLDPRSCASPPTSGSCTSGPLQTFYAIATGDGQLNWRVIRSDDAGATLLDRSAGLPLRITYPDNAGVEYNYPLSVALDPHDARTIYIGTYLQQSWSENGTAPTPTLSNGVFRSRDGGMTWQAVNTGLPRNGDSVDTAIDIYALATDPNVASRLWAAGAFHDGNDGSRIFRSDDAGDHWIEQAAFADCDIRRLLADPDRAGTIRASGTSKAEQGTGCVLRSRDSGESWSRIDAGLPATRVSAMATMPGAPDVVLVGTNTGVWHLRDAPDAIFRDGFD